MDEKNHFHMAFAFHILCVSAWRKRLEQFTHDLEREPQRIRDFYEVRATRIEPVGLVYLWPETN